VRDVFDALVKPGNMRIADNGLSASPSGTSKERRGFFDALKLGDWKHRELLFAEEQRNALGLSYWSRHTVTFDFPAKKVYLETGEHFQRPCWRDMRGLAILRINGRTIVHSVVPGSPAAVAGIQPKDVLLKTSEGPADQFGLFNLRRLLCAARKQTRNSFRRDAEDHEVSMRLRDYRKKPQAFILDDF